jgi:hypothetical protein
MTAFSTIFFFSTSIAGSSSYILVDGEKEVSV